MWKLRQSAWVVGRPAVPGFNVCKLRAPPSTSAHCLSARLRHCNHCASRPTCANRLERSVIANVTTVEHFQPERLAVRQSGTNLEGQMAQFESRERLPALHLRASNLRTLTKAAEENMTACMQKGFKRASVSKMPLRSMPVKATRVRNQTDIRARLC
ncbi:hypothetical protein OPT61_g421 [Boeremia exigua]|uniref:Uncharacterized protein n=1 Tax=Boeremia exigua TaxID=749465 RepID=A0ACC2ITS3_9PLEO|nr:hypothetical protein OPT61_g421 [Boeremia exigua]